MGLVAIGIQCISVSEMKSRGSINLEVSYLLSKVLDTYEVYSDCHNFCVVSSLQHPS